jgi:hypothetical protein
MAAILKQALPAVAPVLPAPGWVNPYQAALDEQTAAMTAPQVPMYTAEQVQDRKDRSNRAGRMALLGVMMGDEGQARGGGQILQQVLGGRQERVTDKGVFDPLSGQMSVNPEYARERTEGRQQRLQDMAARAQDTHESREDQQAFQKAQLGEQIASRNQNAALQRESIRAQKEMAGDERKTRMAGQMYDDWQKVNKTDLDIRNGFANLANTPTGAAGDLAFVYQYMKMLDPGSVVKETEFANAANAAGVPERIRNQWNKLKSGSFLDPAQRAEFLAAAGASAGQADLRIGQKNKFFISRAQNAGIAPSWVIPEYGASSADEEAISGAMPKPGGKPAGAAAPVQSGARPRVTDATSYAALPPGTVYVDPSGKVRTKP